MCMGEVCGCPMAGAPTIIPGLNANRQSRSPDLAALQLLMGGWGYWSIWILPPSFCASERLDPHTHTTRTLVCRTCTRPLSCNSAFKRLSVATTWLYKKINLSHSPPTTPRYSLPSAAFCCNPCTVSAAVRKSVQSIHARCMMGRDKFLQQSFVCASCVLPDDYGREILGASAVYADILHHLQMIHMFTLTKQALVTLCSLLFVGIWKQLKVTARSRTGSIQAVSPCIKGEESFWRTIWAGVQRICHFICL